jgi:PAS domain S-box-containing protein
MGASVKGLKVKGEWGMIKNYGIKIAVVFFLIISTWGLPTYSREEPNNIKFEHISTAQNLPQATVYCILQDNIGYMWFGTQYGLNRFDGYTIKPYTQEPRNPDSLSFNMVRYIYEDQNKVIWIGTWGGGLNKFDRKEEKFVVYRNIPGDLNSLSDNNVWAIYEDKKGILWVGTEKGLNKFDSAKKEFSHYLVEKQSKGKQIQAIYQDRNGNLWIGANDGLYKYNQDSDKFIPYKNITGDINLTNIRAICEDKTGILWIGTESGLFQLSMEKGIIVQYEGFNGDPGKLGEKNIRSIFEDKSGLIWIGTWGDGLYIFNPGEKEFTHYLNDPYNPDSLSNNYINAVYQDKTGLIWIGTQDGGINKFIRRIEKFFPYTYPSSKKNYNVWAFFESKIYEGNIWIATRGEGIYLFNPESPTYEKNHKIPRNISKSPNRNDIRAIFEDNSGKIWIGTVQAGLYIFDPGSGEFKHFGDTSTIKPDEYVLCFYEDHQGFLWIGTRGEGLIRIDKDRIKVKKYKNDPQNPESLSNNIIFSIYEDRSHVLWIGTGGGGLAKCIDREKGIFRHYRPIPDDPTSISHNFISTIYEDQAGILWIATGGGGLNKLIDREKGQFTAYTKKEGLPNDVIYGILEDEQNNLWLSTNKGLSKFNPQTKRFRNYTVRDGLQDYEFNAGASCKTRTGQMFFGGLKGFNAFYPKTIKESTSYPSIAITFIKKYDKEGKLETLRSETRELKLSHNDYFISFEFAALDFTDPDNNRYAYKLEPLNKDWVNLGNKHDMAFPKLEPGKYTLNVIGSNSEDVWNETGTSVKIIVSPPYWDTVWFKIVVVLLAGSIVFTFVRLRIKGIEKKKKEIKEAYDKLQESEERYRTLVETSPDAITLCALNGKIVMANKRTAFLLGYRSVEEMLSHLRTIFRSITAGDRHRARKNAENVLNSGIATNVEFTLRAKDGTLIAAEISTSLIRDSRGDPLYFLTITRDIRERKEAEKKEKLLMQAEKMASLGTLVSGVAHELNNPAGFIMMNADNFSAAWKDIVPVLEQYYKDNANFEIAGMSYKKSKDRIDELIKGLIDGAKRIKEIIRELRNYSRVEDPIVNREIDINQVIQSSLRLTNNTIKKATNTFSLEPVENLPPFWGNYQRLEQVFINLIQNACHSLPDTSKGIFMSTTYDQKKSCIIVKVKDEGAGIEKDNLKYITDPFFTTKRSTGGVGLGLSISNRIIQKHGGRMEFESEVRKGTTVSVVLPVGEKKEKIKPDEGEVK